MWKRVADLSWLALLGSFGVWLAGWLLGVYSYVPTLAVVSGVVAYLIVLESLLLVNSEQGDTLSERIRHMARQRTLVPLVFGVVGGAGIVIATLPIDEAKLKAVGIVAVLGVLAGHFFLPPSPHRRPPAMPLALFGGLAWGVGAATAAAIETSEVNDLFAFLAVAVFGALIGGRFFELRD